MKKKKIITLLAVTAATIGLVGCGKKSNEDIMHEVTIKSLKTATVSVADGKIVDRPANDPVKEGYEFVGWYADNSLYDWNSPVKKDITIEARFTKVLTVKSGTVKLLEDGYQSSKESTLFTLDNKTFNKGSISFDMVNGSSCDAGIILNVSEFSSFSNGWESGVSYYVVLINHDGYILFSQIENGIYTELANSDILTKKFSINATNNIEVQYEDKLLKVYVNNELAINEVVTPFTYSTYGFRSAGLNTTFKNIKVDENKLPEKEEAPMINNYYVNSGNFTKYGQGLYSTENNSIGILKDASFEEGSVSVKVTAESYVGYSFGDNGIVFGLTDNDKLNFWETGVEYYFFFLNKAGQAQLGKVSYGKWENLGNGVGSFDLNLPHTLKVEMRDGSITTYMDDVLCHEVADEEPLLGDKVGIRCGSGSVKMTNFVVNAEHIETTIPDYFDIKSGSVELYKGNLRTTDTNSLFLYNNDVLTNGSLNVTLSTGKGENGVVVGADNNGNYYLLSLKGQNGFVMPTLSKYQNGKLVEVIAQTNMCAMYQVGESIPCTITLKGNKVYFYLGERLQIVKEITPFGNNVGYYSSNKGSLFKNISKCAEPIVYTTSTLIMGHSYTQLWTAYKEAFPEIPDIMNVGIGGTSSEHWVDLIDEVVEYNPETIIFMIGINDIYQSNTSNAIWGKVKTTLDQIHEKLPNTKILLINCNKVNLPEKIALNSMIDELNALYEDYCNKNEYLTLIDYASAVLNEDGTFKLNLFNIAYGDYLHPSGEGYAVLANLIKQALNL